MKLTTLFFLFFFALGATQTHAQLVDQDSGLSIQNPKTAAETQAILQGLLDILENDPAYQGATYHLSVYKHQRGVTINARTPSPKAILDVSGYTSGIYYLRIRVNGQIVCTENFFIRNN